MADFTTNLSNSILASGAGPTTKWGSLIWGTDLWLGPDPIPMTVAFARTIAESLGVADSVILTATFYKLISEGASVSDALNKMLTKMISEAIACSSNQIVGLKKGVWDVVFPGGTLDSTERFIPVFTEATSTAPVWTSLTATTPTWTEL